MYSTYIASQISDVAIDYWAWNCVELSWFEICKTIPLKELISETWAKTNIPWRIQYRYLLTNIKYVFSNQQKIVPKQFLKCCYSKKNILMRLRNEEREMENEKLLLPDIYFFDVNRRKLFEALDKKVWQ